MDGLDYATALLEGLEIAQLPWLQFHPEFGGGQFERSLAAGSVLEAADRLVRAKLVIQRQTSRFGCVAVSALSLACRASAMVAIYASVSAETVNLCCRAARGLAG